MVSENFDNYLRKQLQGHKSVVDAEAIWSAVQLELRPQKRKRRFMWLWWGLGIAIVGTGLFLGLNQFTPNGPQASQAIPVLTTPTPEESAKDLEPPITADQQQMVATTNANISPAPKANFSPKSTKKSNTQAAVVQQDIKLNSVTSSSSTPVYLEDQKEKTPIKIGIPNQRIGEIVDPTQKTAVANILPPTSESTIIPLIETNENNPIQSTTLVEEVTEPEKITPVEAPNQITDPINSVVEMEEALVEKEDEIVEEAVPAIIPPRNAFLRDLTIGVGLRGGISNNLTTLRAFEEDDNGLVDIREASETGLETIDLGLEVLLKHDLGFYVSTGLDYQRYTRKMNFDSATEVIDSVEGITRIYVNPITGDSLKEMGLVARTTTTTQLKEIYNLHEFINIPFSLGYNFAYEAWSFGVEAGAIVNIRTKLKGQIMDSSSSFYDIGKDESNWYKDKVGASFRGSIQIGYTIDELVQIYAGPTFRSPIRLDDKDSPIAQEQTGIGFQLGGRFWFNY